MKIFYHFPSLVIIFLCWKNICQQWICSWDSWGTPELESFVWWYKDKGNIFVCEEIIVLGSGKFLCNPWTFQKTRIWERNSGNQTAYRQWEQESILEKEIGHQVKMESFPFNIEQRNKSCSQIIHFLLHWKQPQIKITPWEWGLSIKSYKLEVILMKLA